jgi:hypothetical protein
VPPEEGISERKKNFQETIWIKCDKIIRDEEFCLRIAGHPK